MRIKVGSTHSWYRNLLWTRNMETYLEQKEKLVMFVSL